MMKGLPHHFPRPPPEHAPVHCISAEALGLQWAPPTRPFVIQVSSVKNSTRYSPGPPDEQQNYVNESGLRLTHDEERLYSRGDLPVK